MIRLADKMRCVIKSRLRRVAPRRFIDGKQTLTGQHTSALQAFY